MVTNKELLIWLNQQLDSDQFKDYSPNGLQVLGRKKIEHIVSGVTASQYLIDQAILCKADALLVHHGYFWSGENPVLIGMKQKRLKALLLNEINLFAYHLPLDAHPQWGNNACLARLLGMVSEFTLDTQGIGNVGYLKTPQTLAQFYKGVENALQRAPQVICAGDHVIKKIAWCSGGAQKYLIKAAEFGVDAFLSGEASENTYHEALELGIHYIAAGHHATERYGVQAVGDVLANEFDLKHTYIEIDNPI